MRVREGGRSFLTGGGPAAEDGSTIEEGEVPLTASTRGGGSGGVEVELSAVIVAVTDDQPRVLTVSDGRTSPGLPTGPLDPAGDRTLDLALRRWVTRQAGMELGYVEQLYTFGDRFRDPREREGGPRVLTVGYLALVREGKVPGELTARWRDVYSFFPWEDWRRGRPTVLDSVVVPAVEDWVRRASGRAERALRRERAAVAFGLGGAPWDGDRVLERYELLYELGLVGESGRDVGALGRTMRLDHRRILATALGRLRGKITYRPVVFELLPERFTLLRLQRAVEALAGVRLHKQNFRRLVERGGLVEGTGSREHGTGGRPAELFRFRREVLLERPAPGVGLPSAGPGRG